ncbi:hypothetical protein SDC9_145113 [bioreactor metagenome]|uniref:Uncharacterized protein n=1 Tax=bioreactor metagenome TaxID=1076179 RepID=A0A645EAS6_9ZZZZ
MLKVLRYAVPAKITAGSALKICKIDTGKACAQINKGIEQSSDITILAKRDFFARSGCPAPIF